MHREEVVKVTFKYKDIFSMKGLYSLARLWLDEEGFVNTSNSLPENFMETLYFEKSSQLGGKENWIWWRTYKILNNYIKLEFNIDYHVLGMVDTEVMYKGTKIKTNKGEVEIFLTATMVTDWQGKWEKHSFLKHVEPLFRKRIYKKELKKIEIEFRKDIYRFQAAMKEYLTMKSYLRKEIPLSPAIGKGMP